MAKYINIQNEQIGEFYDSNTGNSSKIYYLNEKTSPIDFFGPIQNLNIFIGANNSGKSRFLRGILKMQNIVLVENDFFETELKKIKNILEKISSNNELNFAYGFEINSSHIKSTNQNNSSPNFVAYANMIKDSTSMQQIVINDQFLNDILNTLTTFHNSKSEDEKVKKHEAIEKNKLVLKCLLDLINDRPAPYKQSSIRAVTMNHIRKINTHKLFDIKHLFEDIIVCIQQIQEENHDFVQNKKTYIPTLRTTSSIYHKNLEKITEDIFEASIKKNYNFNQNNTSSIEIVTGLSLYRKIRLTRNSEKKTREKFEKFEDFISKNFFNNRIDIVAKEETGDKKNDEHIIIHIENDTSDRNIHDLGDGIQALIILMYPIFMAENGSWIFIEEPEINLHPGLQRIFIEQITQNPEITKKDLKFFITSHSNNILDLTLEAEKNGISIFTFNKETLAGIPIKRIKRVLSGDTDILKLLGVNNSSVFMANCSIWVEGHTDRIYLKNYLKAYIQHFKLNEFKEDLNYSFFEYAGSNISHYLFTNQNDLDFYLPQETQNQIKAQFLSNKIFLISDKDKGKESKHSFLSNQQNKNFKYHVLKSKEIENLISPQKLSNLLTHISKDKIKPDDPLLKGIKHNSYKNEFLGEYINKKLGRKKLIPSSFWVDKKNKTISPIFKKIIADYTTKNLAWSDMTKEAQELAKEVYSFIKNNNNK